MYGGRLEANFHVVVGQMAFIKNIGRCVGEVYPWVILPLNSGFFRSCFSQEEKRLEWP